MRFISDVKLVANLFRKQENIITIVENLEKESIEYKGRAESLKKEIVFLEEKIANLKKQEEIFEENFKKTQNELYMMQQLESVAYINTLISEKGYKMKKLDLSKEPFKSFLNDSWDTCYKKTVVLRAIKFKIQEFASQEGLCYEKLQNALFDINVAWMEAYGNSKNNIVINSYTTNLLLTSFMMLVKENSREKQDKVIKHEVKKD